MKAPQNFIPFILVLLCFTTFCNSSNSDKGSLSNTSKAELKNSYQAEIINLSEVTDPNLSEVNFFLENSGSMFGYVNGGGDFNTVVSTLAADVDLICDQVDFSMLNGQHTPLGGDLENFLSRINLDGMTCGDPSTSDINSMQNRILEDAGEGSISILISDGIYSVSSTGDMLIQLQSQSLETRNKFIRRLEREDLTTYIVKFVSHFEGTYYPYQQDRVHISQLRPYYIWIVGPKNLLQSHFEEQYFRDLPGFQNIVKFVKLSDLDISSQYVIHKMTGKMKIDSHNPFALNNVRPDKKGITRFSIALDFSSVPYDKNYFSDPDIYKIGNGFILEGANDIEVLPPVAAAGLKKHNKYTHVITISKSGAPFGNVDIIVQDVIPAWIEETHSIGSGTIVGDTTHTRGFKYLIDGIAGAYDRVNESENLYNTTYILKHGK